MMSRRKPSIRLSVELLEDRCVPAYLATDPGAFTVRGVSDQARIGNFGFQLQAAIDSTSDPYQAPAAPMQLVTSTPSPFEQVTTPTAAEWNLLSTGYPAMNFVPSVYTLADNSLVIKDAEALGPNRQRPATRLMLG